MIVYYKTCLWLWHLTPLSTIFQWYRGGQFYWQRKLEYSEKTTDLTNWQTLSHNVVSNTSRENRDSNSQLQWWLALITQVVLNPNNIRSWPRQPLGQYRPCFTRQILTLPEHMVSPLGAHGIISRSTWNYLTGLVEIFVYLYYIF